MVTVGATAISHQGNDTLNGMIAGDKKYSKGLKLLAKNIKKNGANASLQIYHVGAQGNPKHNNQEIVGLSKYFFKKIGVKSRSLRINEINQIEDNFCKSIIQAFKSNFDFVELHLAHGYLLHEFLSNYFNKRKDTYGGVFNNRFRIIKNILKRCYKLEPNLIGRIGFRLSANDTIM